MRQRRHTAALLAILAALGVLGLAAQAPAATSAPRAHAAGRCNIKGKEQSLGPTYVTRVEASGGANCAFALRLVRAYDHCRRKHGGVKGTCPGVYGFRCHEHRYAKIVVQYDASVTCARGSERVRENYTQFT